MALMYLNTYVLDRGLIGLQKTPVRLLVAVAFSPNYSEAIDPTNILGEYVPTLIGPIDYDVDISTGWKGRRLTIAAITDGSIILAGTAGYWVLVDDVAQRVMAAGDTQNAVPVEIGNAFEFPEIFIDFPGVQPSA